MMKSLGGDFGEFEVNYNTIQEKNLEYAKSIIEKFLNGELDNVDFRSVPKIMTQAILYKDEEIEIRLHDFSILESDTYIHNHSNPFSSICLEGGYEEKLWNYKKSEDKEEYFFEFERKKNGEIILKGEKQGKLIVTNNRLHFPGNKLENPSHLFHTIGAKEGLGNPFTLILKIKGKKKFEGKVFGKNNILTEPTIPIVPASKKEIENLKEITSDWLKNFLEKQKCNNL